MTKLKFLLIFLLFTTSYLQAQWIRQEAGTSEALNDVFCINADTVLAVGNAGVILKTTDGGEHWIQKSSPFTGYLWKIRFADDTTGYAVGENGIIKTTDAGETWTILPADEDTLYSVSCVNKDTVYISGLHGTIKKTENAGLSWTTQTTSLTETINNIQFVNDTTGFATGLSLIDGYFLTTINGGYNWETQNIGYISTYSLFFCNDTLGYFGESSLWKTVNVGENWNYISLDWWANAYSIYCINPDTIWVAGWEPMNTGGGAIAKSTSGGEGDDAFTYVWGYHEFYNSLHFANDTVGYVVGFYGDENSGWEGLIKKITTGENLSAVKEITADKTFTVYPNPSNGIFTIKSQQTFTVTERSRSNVSITNITGKEIMSMEHVPLQIDISNFPKGIYFLTISNKNHYETQKIIIH